MKLSNKLNSARPHILATFFALIIITLAHHVQAGGSVEVPNPGLPGTEGEGKYQFLAPVSALKGIGGVIDVKVEGFNSYIKAVFNFLIGLIGVFGVVRLVMVGFKMVMNPASSKGSSEAKKEITNIIISFLLVGGSFVFLNTINPDLVNKGFMLNPIHMDVQYSMRELLSKTYDLPPGTDISEMDTHEALDRSTGLMPGWYILIDKKKDSNGNEVKTKEFSSLYPDSGTCGDAAKAMAKAYDDGTSPTHADTSTFSKNCFEKKVYPQTEDEAQIRKSLADAGVYVNKAACTPSNHSSCTSVGSYVDGGKTWGPLSGDIIGKIVTLAGALGQSSSNCTNGGQAGCVVVVTGGTEHWQHKSHGNPYTFDLRRTPGLLSYILSHATVQAPSFDGHTRYLYDDVWFTDEDSAHFHECTSAVTGVYCQEPTGVTCFMINSAAPKTLQERQKRGILVTGDNVKVCGKGAQ